MFIYFFPWEPTVPSFLGVITHILGVQNIHFSWFWGPRDVYTQKTPTKKNGPNAVFVPGADKTQVVELRCGNRLGFPWFSVVHLWTWMGEKSIIFGMNPVEYMGVSKNRGGPPKSSICS